MAATVGRYFGRLAAMTTLSTMSALGLPLASGAATPKWSAAGADTVADQSVATLVVEHQDVEIQRDGEDAWKDAKDGAELHEGDSVRTDEEGRATIEYTDESFTRLDVNTEFTIVELTDDEGNRHTTGSLTTGQIWNRVEDLSESDKFETEGAGATAAVVGTAYVVQCGFDGLVCNVKGVVHDVDITGLDAPTNVDELEQLVINQGHWGKVDLVSLEEFFGDEWIQANLAIDEALGFPGPDWMKAVIVHPGPNGTIEVQGIVVFAPNQPEGAPPEEPPGGTPPPPPPPPSDPGNGWGAAIGNNKGGASFDDGSGRTTGNCMSQGAGQGHGAGQPDPTTCLEG